MNVLPNITLVDVGLFDGSGGSSVIEAVTHLDDTAKLIETAAPTAPVAA